MRQTSAKTLVVASLVFLIIIALFARGFKWDSFSRAEGSATVTQSAEVAAEGSSSDVPYAVVRLCPDGVTIGIFTREEDTTPVRVLEVDTSGFPEADMRALQKGIKVYSFEELMMIIEDYTS